MAKSVAKPILPAHKRARCSNPARYVTDGIRAFDIGRGGMAPPAWVEANHGMLSKWQAGFKQRGKFVSAMERSKGQVRLTDYELSLRKQEREEAGAADDLLEKQMAQLKAVFAAQGIHLTRQALAKELSRQ